MKQILLAGVSLAMLSGAPAIAGNDGWGGPVDLGNGVTLDPIADMRLRYEHVEQASQARDANALTMRLRAGADLRAGDFSLLVEGESTLAIVQDYNAFAFVAPKQNRPYPVVADPENIELNRAQIAWQRDGYNITLGRQRINLDDQRWVGAVGWRQNEQTFDALRGTARLGPLSLDASYAISQRTMFGIDAGPRQAYDGHFIFAAAGLAAGPVNIKGFAYLLDYDWVVMQASSTQTYGALATGSVPFGTDMKLSFKASYARQSDWKANARNFSADYHALEATVSGRGVAITGGYELLGSDKGTAVSTPMATLHKFNGWADIFSNTPANGLRDLYAGASYTFPATTPVRGLNASVTWHDFRSDSGGVHYGSEWDASLGFRLGPVTLLAKYADYNAKGFAADTRKFWLQAEYGF